MAALGQAPALAGSYSHGEAFDKAIAGVIEVLKQIPVHGSKSAETRTCGPQRVRCRRHHLVPFWGLTRVGLDGIKDHRRRQPVKWFTEAWRVYRYLSGQIPHNRIDVQLGNPDVCWI